MEDIELIAEAETKFPPGTTVRFTGYTDDEGEDSPTFKVGDILTVIEVCDEEWPGGLIVRKGKSKTKQDMVWPEEIEVVTENSSNLRITPQEVERLQAAVSLLSERYLADAGDPREADVHQPGFSQTFSDLQNKS
jgi:hypothetical protein